MLYKRIVVLFLSAIFILTGCNSPMYNQTEGNIADVTLRAKEAQRQSDAVGKYRPSLLVNDGAYVDKTPIDLASQPSWLKNHIVMRGDQLPFSYYSRTLVANTGHNVLTHYQTGLDPTTMVSMNYTGTVKGALDLLAAKTNFIYSVHGNSIYWQAFVTKTFDIAFMPGSSDYLMGKSGGGGSVSAAATSGSGGTVVSAILDDSAAAQYSSLKGTLSIWKDLENTIRQLMSPQGSVIVSESTTSVTVRDRPSNLELISKYIGNLNRNLSKQVLVKVQILDVNLSSDYSLGINWDAVETIIDGRLFKFTADYSTPISITPLGGAAVPTIGFDRNNLNGVTALMKALQQQGKVSLVTEPRVLCLNNQVSVIRIVTQEGYLASLQNTTVPGTAGSSSSVTSQLTPGTLVTGFTLYVLPKILGDKVYLQVNADISTKIAITAISSITGGNPPANTTAAQAGSTIQVPSVQQKQFNQRSVVTSGATLIISGFRQVGNQTGAMQFFDSQALGGKAASQSVKETIVLITPIILHGSA